MKLNKACILGAVATVSGQIQHPFSDERLFSPFEDLSALSSSEYTALGHPFFPNYGVRIKKSDFCDGTVGAYTGYIDVEARHLFFYFFESRNKPDQDDVMFWTNGGPGCSSSTGLFMELGPCRVDSPTNISFNPYGWNEYVNIFFIDQPIGTGFSYAEHGEYVSNTEEAAKDIGAFIVIFFEHFTKFKGRTFHMAGESYAGRAVPTYASYIYDQNARLVQAGLTPINLTSIMIGNGCTDWSTMLPSYYHIQCQNTSSDPIGSISSCMNVKRMNSRCEKWLKESCYDTTDSINCEAAWNFCSNIAYAFQATERNPYDITKFCGGYHDSTMCYPISRNINEFLSQPHIRELIGVDPSLQKNFSNCNIDVLNWFGQNHDRFFPAQYYIAALLERGIRALIYVGANDWVCNWIGNERMTLELEWTGQQAFVSQPLREWAVDGHVAGLTRSAGPFTFATIYGAGHMAPYDKPKESLELMRRWIFMQVL